MILRQALHIDGAITAAKERTTSYNQLNTAPQSTVERQVYHDKAMAAVAQVAIHLATLDYRLSNKVPTNEDTFRVTGDITIDPEAGKLVMELMVVQQMQQK